MSGKASQVHDTAKLREPGMATAKSADPRGNFADLLREVETLGAKLLLGTRSQLSFPADFPAHWKPSKVEKRKLLLQTWPRLADTISCPEAQSFDAP